MCYENHRSADPRWYIRGDEFRCGTALKSTNVGNAVREYMYFDITVMVICITEKHRCDRKARSTNMANDTVIKSLDES
jgi:hypothetical protein